MSDSFEIRMAMPIAVGHHIYTDTTQKAWQSWLDGLFA